MSCFARHLTNIILFAMIWICFSILKKLPFHFEESTPAPPIFLSLIHALWNLNAINHLHVFFFFLLFQRVVFLSFVRLNSFFVYETSQKSHEPIMWWIEYKTFDLTKLNLLSVYETHQKSHEPIVWWIEYKTSDLTRLNLLFIYETHRKSHETWMFYQIWFPLFFFLSLLVS